MYGMRWFNYLWAIQYLLFYDLSSYALKALSKFLIG